MRGGLWEGGEGVGGMVGDRGLCGVVGWWVRVGCWMIGLCDLI